MIHAFNVITAAVSTYICSVVITSSTLFEGPRAVFKSHTIGTIFDKKTKHFIECRLCVSFWFAVVFSLIFSDFTDILTVYGISYFMATQER